MPGLIQVPSSALKLMSITNTMTDLTQAESSKSDDLLARRMKIVANGVGVFNASTVDHAQGATIVDLDGREWIDLAGGIGVVNAGHCPAPVVKAIQEQAANSCTPASTWPPTSRT
jgi:4-aminobutyrate aminotransferase-like enzyme